MKKILTLLMTWLYILNVLAKKSGEKADWAKKNIRDYRWANI